MDGTLTKMLGPYVGKGGKPYTKLYFENKAGNEYYSYAVEGNRNYKRWQMIAEEGVGTEVTGLKVWRNAVIDADSPVKFAVKKAA